MDLTGVKGILIASWNIPGLLQQEYHPLQVTLYTGSWANSYN